MNKENVSVVELSTVCGFIFFLQRHRRNGRGWEYVRIYSIWWLTAGRNTHSWYYLGHLWYVTHAHAHTWASWWGIFNTDSTVTNFGQRLCIYSYSDSVKVPKLKKKKYFDNISEPLLWIIPLYFSASFLLSSIDFTFSSYGDRYSRIQCHISLHVGEYLIKKIL